MQFVTVAESVATEFEDTGVYGLSVVVSPGMDRDQLLEAFPRPHGVFRTSTIEAIEAAGLVLGELDAADPGHALVVFPGPPTYEQWERLDAAFQAPEPNPGAGG